VALQKLINHASKAEPISATVVAHAFAQHFGCHVPVRAHARVRLLFTAKESKLNLRIFFLIYFEPEIASQTEVADPHVAVLVE
jgi:hypothetical protein